MNELVGRTRWFPVEFKFIDLDEIIIEIYH